MEAARSLNTNRERPTQTSRPRVAPTPALVDQIGRYVSGGVRRASQRHKEERQRVGLPSENMVTRIADTTGGVASGMLNSSLRPVAHIGQTIDHPLQALRVGPFRAFTGILKLGASAMGRVLLGKNHHEKKLGFFGRCIKGVKDAVYGLHDFAMKDYDFDRRKEPTSTPEPKPVLKGMDPKALPKTIEPKKATIPPEAKKAVVEKPVKKPNAVQDDQPVIPDEVPSATIHDFSTPSRVTFTPPKTKVIKLTRKHVADCVAKCTKSKACKKPKAGCKLV